MLAAAWFAAVGTVGAFAATWFAIWRDHKLRREERDEVLFDEALLVTYRVAPVADNSSPPEVKTAAGVVVHNGGRRPVTHLMARLMWEDGHYIDDRSLDFLQSGHDWTFQFPVTDDMWVRAGGSPRLGTQVHLSFNDNSGHRWVLHPDGRLDHKHDPIIVTARPHTDSQPEE